ncbi:hypothetical protein GHT09_001572 [Marmota monax]|uniref:Uncharacterized protein n=1 Tax=Marmota monax TaxID=9995 RepID=A0A834PXN8_MARMO|nr:hypothetical protein GHT09_001572 [Marmota monax]
MVSGRQILEPTGAQKPPTREQGKRYKNSLETVGTPDSGRGRSLATHTVHSVPLPLRPCSVSALHIPSISGPSGPSFSACAPTGPSQAVRAPVPFSGCPHPSTVSLCLKPGCCSLHPTFMSHTCPDPWPVPGPLSSSPGPTPGLGASSCWAQALCSDSTRVLRATWKVGWANLGDPAGPSAGPLWKQNRGESRLPSLSPPQVLLPLTCSETHVADRSGFPLQTALAIPLPRSLEDPGRSLLTWREWAGLWEWRLPWSRSIRALSSCGTQAFPGNSGGMVTLS